MTSHDDAGFALIEVLVSAVLVVLIALGVFAGLDYASRASASQRSRTAASALAEADQQRVRALSPTALSSLSTTAQTSTATENGVLYTTTSSASWVDDRATSGTCAGDVSSARYLKITSSTAWNGVGSPVKEDSLISAPSGGGTLAVELFDRNKDPLSGVTVNLSGGRTASATTGAGGCVEWDYLPAGNYTVSFAQPGYVNPQGVNAVSQTATVSDGKTNTLLFDYDRAGSIDVKFWTQIGSTQYKTTAPQQSDRITLAQSGLAAPLTFGTVGSPKTLIGTDGPPATPGQFPFTSTYSVFAGDCTGEDPATYGMGGDTTAKPQVTIAPGTLHQGPVWVRLPSVDLTTQTRTANGFNGTSTVNGVTVVFTRAAANGCPATRTTQVSQNDPVTGGAGSLPYPGFAWGSYSVCAQAQDTNGSWHYTTTPWTFTTPSTWTATNTLVVDVRTSATTTLGQCP